MSSERKLILSLCDLTGNWPKFYREAGYDVRQVDLQRGGDVRLMYKPSSQVHGILAAPPCTVFANSGNRWPRTDEQMIEALSIVDACLRLVTVCRPKWWALENPVGKLQRWLGKPRLYFNPCDYGDPYTKRTCLWGEFTIPEKTPVEPVLGSKMHTKVRDQNARSATPLGFAEAFFKANP